MAATKAMAARAWARLGHRGENQAVVFLYVMSKMVPQVNKTFR